MPRHNASFSCPSDELHEDSGTGSVSYRSKLATSVASLLMDRAFFAEVGPLCSEVYRQAVEHLAKNDEVAAAAFFRLAECLQARNHLAEAELLMRQAVAILGNPEGEPLLYFGRSLRCLAGLLKANGKMKEAESAYRAALSYAADRGGPLSAGVGTASMNLAVFLHEQGRSVEALPRIQYAEESFRCCGVLGNYVHHELAEAEHWLRTIRQAVESRAK